MKAIYIINHIVIAIAFICITITAISFQKTGILWWYLVPFFMGVLFTPNEREVEGECPTNTQTD